MLHANVTAQAIDDALAETFPASDPPAWTPGMARPAPEIVSQAAGPRIVQDQTSDVHGPEVIDVSRPTHSKRTFAQGLVSLIGVAGVALVVPFAMLAVGIPVALGIRGLLEFTEWFLAVFH